MGRGKLRNHRKHRERAAGSGGVRSGCSARLRSGAGAAHQASMRFERGAGHRERRLALDRAAQLIELLGAGEVVRGVIDVRAQAPRDHVIATTASRLNRYMGVTVETAEMVSILSRLGIAVTVEGDSLICRIPATARIWTPTPTWPRRSCASTGLTPAQPAPDRRGQGRAEPGASWPGRCATPYAPWAWTRSTPTP